MPPIASRALTCLLLMSLAGHRVVGQSAPVRATHPKGVPAGRVSDLSGRPFGIRVSSTGEVFVTQQDANSVARFRLDDRRLGAFIPVGADPGDVLFTRDGQTAFVSNFNDGTVHAIEVATGRSIRVLAVAPTNAYRLALSPDGARLFVTSTDGHLYAVDPTGAEATMSAQLHRGLQGIAVGRDGAVTVASADGVVWRLDGATLAVRTMREVGDGPLQDIALSRDQRELYMASEDGHVEVLDARSLEPLRRLWTTALRPFGLAVTPDGAQLYVTSPASGHVAVLDPRSGRVIRRHVVGGRPRRVAFDATGAVAVIANEGNWVDVIR